MAKIGSGGIEGENSGAGIEPIGDNRDGGIVDSIAVIDPASLGSGNGNGGDGNDSDGNPVKRKRGRPAGSGNGNRAKPTAQEAKTAVSGIEPLLLSLHKGIAGLLHQPEFALDPKEARALSESMVNVASQYSVEVNPKYMAWIALCGCLLAIYGPRFGAMFVAKKVREQKPVQGEQKQEPEFGTLRPVAVTPFVPPQSFAG